MIFKRISILILLAVSAVFQVSPAVFDSIKPAMVVIPHSIQEVCNIITQAHAEGKKLSIAGAQQSKGNQTASAHAIMIDTTKLNQILNIDIAHKTVTVQAGITWDELEQELNKHQLSVLTRQSYCNFSVGGSIGVNAMGQNVHASTLSESIEELVLVDAQGKLIRTSRTENPELFWCAIGGYGLVGIIIEATLRVTQNVILKKTSTVMPLEEYVSYFFREIHANPSVHFHSARLSINPKKLFDNALCITFSSTNHADQQLEQLKDLEQHKTQQLMLHSLRKSTLAKKVRMPIESLLVEKDSFISRNNALRETTTALTPLENSRDILQQYYIPCHHMYSFLQILKNQVTTHKINLLNLSVRFVRGYPGPLLNYAAQDCFALVLYVNLKGPEQHLSAQTWTKNLIDEAIKLGGSFYLPYELFATKEQVHKAYPNIEKFGEHKKIFDPECTFTNTLFEKYCA